jgi:hypothetical protein
LKPFRIVFLALVLFVTIPAFIYPQSNYNFYFGDIHSHSWYSDGNQDQDTTTWKKPVARSFTWARQNANSFHFLGISDHNHNESLNMTLGRWRAGNFEADSVNQDGIFSTLYGQEWGTTATGGGHSLIYGTDKLFGWNPGVYDVYVPKNSFSTLIDSVKKYNGFIYLAHPSTDQFGGIFTGSYNALWDSVVQGVAIKNGPAFSTNTTESDPASSNYESRYHDLLKKGYHVAPIGNQDNHNTTFGRANQQRTAVLATSLTRANVLDAFRSRRVYATEDHNLQLLFEVDTHLMGEIFSTGDTIRFRIKITDPDAESVSLIELRYGVPGSGSAPTVLTSVSSRDSLIYSHVQTINSTYYYYVHVVQADGNDAWSAPMWITQTASAAPGSFAQLTPSDGSMDHPISGTLTWETSPNASQYDVYLDVANPPTTIVSVNQVSTSYVYSGLSNNVTYYWKIVAKNAEGQTASTGSPWNFTTVITAPGDFSLLAPSDNALDQPLSGTLSWQSSFNASQYDVYLDVATPPTTIISANQVSTSYSYSGLTNGTIYYWKIVAKNAGGQTVNTGDSWDFTTIVAAPGSFMLLSPSDGTTDVPINGTFSWQSSLNAAQYDVYLDVVNPPENVVSANQVATSYSYYNLTNSETYYWKVVAKNVGGQTTSAFSPWSFFTSSISPPLPSSGLSIHTLSSSNVTLEWTDNATDELGYRVYRSLANEEPFVQLGQDLPANTELFFDTSVASNVRYHYRVMPFNSGGESIPDTITVVTLAEVPGQPTLIPQDTVSLTCILEPANNSSSTQFSIWVNDGIAESYVQSDGTLGELPVWQTYGEWGGAGGIIITGLQGCVPYSVSSKARNDEFLETSFSPSAVESTTCFVSVVSSVSEGWNLISLPMTTASNQRTVLFPESISSAYYYDKGYRATDSLESGVGYWMKFPAEDVMTFEGELHFIDTIAINRGWNIIGSISTPVAISAVVEEPAGLITTSYYAYNGGYDIADVILPAKGYWVKANANGQLILSSTLSSMAKIVTSSAIPKNISSTLTFTDMAGRTQKLFLLRNDEGRKSLSMYELPPIPPAGAFDVRFASHQKAVFLKTESGDEVSQFQIKLQSSGTPISVSLTGDDVRMRYEVNDGKNIHTLSEGLSVVLPEHQSEVTFIVKPKSNRTHPETFALFQNYPNPFNPSTEISYQLPSESFVRLTVFNLLGENVATLINEKQSSGIYSVTWQPNVPSGLYYYRMDAVNTQNPGETFQQVRRMLLLK